MKQAFGNQTGVRDDHITQDAVVKGRKILCDKNVDKSQFKKKWRKEWINESNGMKDHQEEVKWYSACGVQWEPGLDSVNPQFLICDTLKLTHEVNTCLFSFATV